MREVPGPKNDAEADAMQVEILRRSSGAQRLRIALEMSDLAREFSRVGIRSRHPDWSEAEVSRELLRYAFFPESVPDWLP
jgi:hypothetical protein